MGRVKKGTEKKDSKKDAKKAEKGPKKNGEKVDGGTNFRRSGAKGGTAKSTLSGYQSALYHFNAFLEVKGLPCFDDLSEQELCCIELFQEYGTYLSEFARKKRKVFLLCFFYKFTKYSRYYYINCRTSCSLWAVQSSFSVDRKHKRRRNSPQPPFGLTKFGILAFGAT